MAATAVLLLAACATGERAPASGDTDPDEGGATVVGRVTPSGELRADTLDGGERDTTRVERETVLTGRVTRETDPDRVLATGWRVQVFASRDRDEAEAFARGVEDRMERRPVYVEWSEPWFKVRIGDFVERDAAEALQRRLVELGFEDAWTVRTTIRTVQ